MTTKRGLLATVVITLFCSVVMGNEKSLKILAPSNLSLAESFVSAFYSFDPLLLLPTLIKADKSRPSIVYYQGWAKGGHYKIVDRMPCKEIIPGQLSCSITVEDDLMKALAIDFDVTDTFTLTFDNGDISEVSISSNDLKVYRDAAQWVRENLATLVELPCKGFFNGGPTPGQCAQAMAQGYRQFAFSNEFPKQYKLKN